MATYMGQTVDVFEDFEDSTLDASLSETDTESNLTVSSGTQYKNGSAAMECDADGMGAPAYLSYTTDVGNISVGFWYRTPALADWSYMPALFTFLRGGYSDMAYVEYKYSGDQPYIKFWIAASSTTINVSSGAWYWITGQVNRNATSYWALYDSTGTQVGSTYSSSAADYNVDRARIGMCDIHAISSTEYFDDYVIDSTDGTFPLLGWESGKSLAGGISGASTTSSFLPYIYHYLIDNVVSGAASLGTLLPYLYHYLVNNAISAVSSLSNFLPYLYHYLVNNVVSGATTLYGNIVITSEQIIHALAGAIEAISSLPSLLPEIWHYLINNTVAAVSSIANTLPYITHRLLSDTFAAVSSIVGNIELFGEGVIRVLAGAVDAVSSTFGSLQLFGIRLFTAAVDGVSTIVGNLTNLGGSLVNKLRIYMKIHRGRF